MCIIAVKRPGVSVPVAEFVNCYENNADGAGFMIQRDTGVAIYKGFMTLYSFLDAAESVSADDMAVFHFRQATHGKVVPALTHPFPVLADGRRLRSTRCMAEMGAAHNGIVRIKRRKAESDTMAFIRKVLADPDIYYDADPHFTEIVIDYYLGWGRLALLTASDIRIYGDGWVDADGMLYSNRSYQYQQLRFPELAEYNAKVVINND
jgi:hypothetical protein